MSLRLASICPAVLLLSLAGCGGEPPPKAPSGPPTPAPAAAPGIDTSEVPEPPTLIAIARVARPNDVLGVVGGWTHLPLPQGNELMRSITDDAVASAVDLTQPIDAAASLTAGKHGMKPLYAVSLAVKSVDDAKTKLSATHTLTPGENGQIRVEAARTGKNDDPIVKDCVLAPAPSGGRLVCGDDAALEALVPYLARTMPRKSWTSDFHLEVLPAAAKGSPEQARAALPFLARQAFGGGASGSTRAILDAAMGEAVDVFADTKRIAIDAKIADGGIDTTIKIGYASATSFVAKLGASGQGRSGSPPPAFFHLPADTDVAFFGRGSDTKLFDHMRELLGNLVIELGESSKMAEAERKALRELLVDRTIPLLLGPAIFAKGYDAATLEKTMAAKRAMKTTDTAAYDDAERVEVEQMLGWQLLQTSQPIANVGPVLKEWAALYNRPAFAKWAKEHTTSKMLAKVHIAPNPAGLPKEAVHLEISLPRPDIEIVPTSKNAKPKMLARKPILVHVLAVPDENATWLAFGLDVKLAGKTVAATLASAPESATLAKAPGIEAFKQLNVNGAGFMLLRGLLVFTAAEADGGGYGKLAKLPNKGATPITFTYTAEPGAGDSPAGTVSSAVHLPRPVIEDLVSLVLEGLR